MPTVDPVALTKRRRTTLARLALITGQTLERIWAALDGYTDDQQSRFVTLAQTAVIAGQNRAIDTTVAGLAALIGETVDITNRPGLLAMARVDVRQPFVAFARALDAGTTIREAIEAGAARASGVGESSVHWAARAANNTVEGHRRIRGWRRVLDGNACEWCQVVSTQRYRTSDSASFGHLRCGCTVEPIVGDSDPGRVINSELLADLKRSGAVGRSSDSRARSRTR